MSIMRSRVCTAVAVIGVGLGTSALGQGQGRSEETPTTSTVERYVTTTNDQEVVIEIRNGEITEATINGEAIDPKKIERLEDGSFRIDQPGEEADVRIEVGKGANGVGGSAGVRNQIVVVGPHGEPTTIDIPAWTVARGQGFDAPLAYTLRRERGGEPPKVMIGVQMSTPSAELAGHLGVKPEETTLVAGVYDDLPASKAGLERYDVIVEVNGKRPAGGGAIREVLQDAEPGDTLSLKVLRRGKEQEVEVTLAPWDEEALSQGLPGLTDEQRLAREEAMRAMERLRGNAGAWVDEDGATTFMVPAPRAPAALERENEAIAERLAQVEEQLRRVEEMLRRLEGSRERERERPAPEDRRSAPPAEPHEDEVRWEHQA